jgi:hypothetical protein
LSFIRPILEYGNVIWDNCTQNEANLLESVQVEAGKIITGLRVNSSRSKLYSELGWEPLYKSREKQKLILLYKIINGLTPDYMYDMIQPYTDFVEAGRPFQSRNVQGMKLLLNETVLQKGSLTLSPDICCRRL